MSATGAVHANKNARNELSVILAGFKKSLEKGGASSRLRSRSLLQLLFLSLRRKALGHPDKSFNSKPRLEELALSYGSEHIPAWTRPVGHLPDINRQACGDGLYPTRQLRPDILHVRLCSRRRHTVRIRCTRRGFPDESSCRSRSRTLFRAAWPASPLRRRAPPCWRPQTRGLAVRYRRPSCCPSNISS